MAMTDEEFDALVKKLENYAQRKPGQYKLRVGLLAVLGYSCIFLVLAGLLALIVFLVATIFYFRRFNSTIIKLIAILIVPSIIIASSLWVKLSPPDGLELHRKKTPELFRLLDELTTALQTPSFHHVLIVSEFNAAVVQIPRLGILGWQENYLLVGLPLMQALSPKQFRAVLAHELGHLSGNHSRFAAWIYRLRKTWEQIWQRLRASEEGATTALFEYFLNWYYPFFNAYSFVLARSNEYEADRCAKQLAGQESTATALLNIELKARFLEESFWKEIYQQTDSQPEPPKTLFHQMAESLAATLEAEKEQKWLQEALEVKTNNIDTHPCLSERLQALGYSDKEKFLKFVPVKITAAQKYLGRALKSLTMQLDQEWSKAINQDWKERYSYVQKLREEIQRLEKKTESQTLTTEESWNYAHYTLELEGKEKAFPLLQVVLEKQPNHISANHIIGQILLSRQDEQGIEYLEKVITQDPQNSLRVYQLIYSFLKKNGRDKDANRYRERAEKLREQIILAEDERSYVNRNDNFIPHQLSTEQEKALSQQINQYPNIEAAYLVRKELQYFPEEPLYVLAVLRKKSFMEVNEEDESKKLITKLVNELECPGDTLIITLNNLDRTVRKKIQKTAIAAIYRA